MRSPRSRNLALLGALATWLVAHSSDAKCRRQPSISESLKEHPHVFLGRVVFDLSSPERQQVLVHPITWFKRGAAIQPLIVVRNAEPPFACATRFLLGQRYLFFSSTPLAPWIHEVRACDPNRSIDQVSSQDLTLLRGLAPNKSQNP